MTLQEIREKKKELGLTNEMLAEKSGIPLGTIQKVICGITKSPRKRTIDALSDVLRREHDTARKSMYDLDTMNIKVLQEEAAKYLAGKEVYTIQDIYDLPDGVRAELMDGNIYFMATPTRLHQKITGEMHLAVANYIRSRGGKCEVYIPPFSVFLFGDDSTYVEPDLSVICDPSKLDDRGCVGAPDWVVEVLSPSSTKMDCMKKLIKYRNAGVKEYWIIHPEKRIVTVYLFSSDEKKEAVTIYSFEDKIPCSLFPDLLIRLADVV